MYTSLVPLILGSGSPRRQQFFKDLGLNYSVKTADIEEIAKDGEAPEAFVSRMAKEKAQNISFKNKGSWIVAADTIVCLDNTILGKPENEDDAVRMLCALSGRVHTVFTSFCLMNYSSSFTELQTVSTNVYFSSFTSQTAMAYVKTGEPMDKAGSYGIQGKGGVLVERIEGSISNVIGLPLVELIDCLEKNSIISL